MQYDDFSKSREAFGRKNMPPKGGKPLGWLVLFFVLLALAAGASFGVAVFQELGQRQARLNHLVNEVKPEGDGSLLDNQLIGQLAEEAGGATETTTVGAVKNETRQMLEKSDRPALGNAEAGLVIVEFADFECSVCKEAFSAIRTITNRYPNDIRFIFRNYPVIDDNSSMLAQASLCANEQNKFWQFHDRLFMNTETIADLESLKAIALKSGLNWTALTTCISSEKYGNQVMSDMSDALDAGVAGTPTFFINGSKLEGAVTLTTWEEIIKKYKELNK